MGMTGSRTGTLDGKDSFESAKRNMIVGGGLWSVVEGSKATKDDEGSENFRGRS